MNMNRINPQDFFFFDENAAGTGGSPPPGGSTPTASPVPSSTPEPAAASPTPSSGAPAAPGSDPFSGLDGDFDSDLDTIILPAEPPAVGGAVATPAAPAPDAPVVPAASTPPGASPPVQPATPTPAPAAPVPTSNASPRAQLDSTIEGFKTNQNELAAWAGENLFKLSAADVEALTTNAEEVIPRLLGKVYTQALAATGNLIRNFTPGLIDHAIEASHTSRTKSQEAIGEFYKTNSDLNEAAHGDSVAKWAKSYRLANPTATRKEAIDFVARAVRIEAGLAMPGAAPAAAARQAPFAPARPGGRQPAPANEHDPFAGLGMEFDE